MATLETLLWCLLIGFAWLAAARAPEPDTRDRHREEEEDQRLWYGAELRNRTDRGS
jgi:hypothetical protein